MNAFSQGLTRYPEKTKNEARGLYALGHTPTEIAKRLGVSSDVVVRRWCDEAYRQKYNERAKLRARAL